jgi:hypothetical protein
MNTRSGTAADIPGILALQELNIVTNLSEEQKKNGFVTTPFTEAQLLDLIRIDGLFVVADGTGIAGYTMAAGWDYFQGRPMFDLMIERFQKLEYRGIRITRANSFQYGPICIDQKLRGTPAFTDLFAFMKTNMQGRFPVGTTFINTVNERSFQAHTRKAKIDVIDRFDFNGNHYYGLAFLTAY